MSEQSNGISRRKLLGTLGAAGGASALGGAATSALLWDEEKFGNAETPNVLQAGALDLGVDWEEHYADWIGEETNIEGVRMVESAEDLQEGEAGLPTPDNPMLAVPSESVDDFMDATIEEEQDIVKESAGPDGPNDQPEPVITLQDVKPGDFGEVTFSYHIFDNPGFASVCAEEFRDIDNPAGIDNGNVSTNSSATEPEDKVNGHNPDDWDGTEGGDLGDHIQATAWYDPNCDNLLQGGGEVEVMLAVDVSESMNTVFPGTPTDITDVPDTEESRLAAVKGIIGEYDGGGFLSDLEETCSADVEIGTVSAAQNLHHLDNLADGDDDDDPAGFGDGGLDKSLDKALTPVGAGSGTVHGNEHGYQDLKTVYAPGNDAGPDFVTDDPDYNEDYDNTNSTNTYEAERGYTPNGQSTQEEGVIWAHRALLPESYSGERNGVDPSGNAAPPGEARKILVPIIDGSFSDRNEGIDQSVAVDISDAAEGDGIEIHPVVVTSAPRAAEVAFAESLSTSGVDPIFATQYDGTPDSCDSDVTDAGYSCVSLDQAMDQIRQEICSSVGEQRLAGPAPISDVIDELDDCTLLDPVAAGATVAQDFPGTQCTQNSQEGCIALAWWLPRDIPSVNDNIIQLDSYEFQISFSAVQCRHNVADDGGPIDGFPGDSDATDGAEAD